MWAYGQWNRFGVDSLKYSLVNLKVEPASKQAVKIVSIVKAEGKLGFGAYHTATYLINGDGDVTVDNKIQFTGLRINLARIGVRYEFDKKFDKMTYFGRGPIENYADRKTASDVGLYTLDVNDQYECEKPMEHGNNEDVRWASFSGNGMPSVTFKSDNNLMQVSALPYTDEQMQNVEYKIDLPASNATVFTLSTKTLGVGSNGCGPRPLDKYMVWSDNTEFSYTLKLLK